MEKYVGYYGSIQLFLALLQSIVINFEAFGDFILSRITNGLN